MSIKSENLYPGLINEKTILGIFIGNGHLLGSHILELKPVFFRVQEYRLIYQAMLDLNRENVPVDEHLLLNSLSYASEGHDWKKEISELLLLSSLHEKLDYFIGQLKEQFLNERLSDLSVLASNTKISIENRVGKGIQMLFDLKELGIKKQEEPISKLLQEFLVRGAMIGKNDLVQTGWKDLDAELGGGFEQKQLIIVGARPGMGKSGFLAGICNHLVLNGLKKVLFISFNFNSEKFIKLLVANQTDTPINLLNDPDVMQSKKETLNALVQAENDGTLQYHFQRSNDVQEMLAVMGSRKENHGLDVVIIDSLQQLEESNFGSYITRNNSLGKSLKRLKQMAEELNVLLIIGSEVSRRAERNSSSCRPQLSDLKDSGWIEELADKVLFIYRAEYYDMVEWEDGSPTQNEAEIMIAKNNLGQKSEVRMHYDISSFKFSDSKREARVYSKNELEIPATRKNEYE